MSKNLMKKWFMVHTYSGYEKKVKADLEQKIETLNITEKVMRIMVPEEESIEIVREKKKIVTRKLFPGYVMIEMLAEKEETDEGITFKVDSDAWYIVRNTNGVTGFVGVGSDPIPMEDNEVENVFRIIGIETPKAEKITIDFKVGDYVKILKGGFAKQEGKVSEIDMIHGKAKVMIDVFGRMTPVELGFESVQKI